MHPMQIAKQSLINSMTDIGICDMSKEYQKYDNMLDISSDESSENVVQDLPTCSLPHLQIISDLEPSDDYSRHEYTYHNAEESSPRACENFNDNLQLTGTTTQKSNRRTLTSNNIPEYFAPYPQNLMSKIFTDWKSKFYSGEIKSVLPDNYTIVDRPAGVQFRSPLWVSGILLRKNDSPELKWFCLASETCVQSNKFYTASRSNSKVVKHLCSVHGYKSSRASSGRSKRKVSDLFHNETYEAQSKRSYSNNNRDPNDCPTMSYDKSAAVTKQILINVRDLELRLAFKSIKSFETFRSIDSDESQGICKMISLASYSSKRYKQILLELYSSITNDIIRELSLVKTDSVLPMLGLHISFKSIGNNSMLTAATVQVSFVNMYGHLREHVLASRIIDKILNSDDLFATVITKWIRDVLDQYQVQEYDIMTFTVSGLHDQSLKEVLMNSFNKSPWRLSLIDLFSQCLVKIVVPMNIILRFWINIVRIAKGKNCQVISISLSSLHRADECLSLPSPNFHDWANFFDCLSKSFTNMDEILEFMSSSSDTPISANDKCSFRSLPTIFAPLAAFVSNILWTGQNLSASIGKHGRHSPDNQEASRVGSTPLIFVTNLVNLMIHLEANLKPSDEFASKHRDHVIAVLYETFFPSRNHDGAVNSTLTNSLTRPIIDLCAALYPPTRNLKYLSCFQHNLIHSSTIDDYKKSIWRSIKNMAVNILVKKSGSSDTIMTCPKSYFDSLIPFESSMCPSISNSTIQVWEESRTQRRIDVEHSFHSGQNSLWQNTSEHHYTLSQYNPHLDLPLNGISFSQHGIVGAARHLVQTPVQSIRYDSDVASNNVYTGRKIHSIHDIEDSSGSDDDDFIEDNHNEYVATAAYAGSGIGLDNVTDQSQPNSTNYYLKIAFEANIDLEINSYLSMKKVDIETLPIESVGQWWVQKSLKFPRLSVVAQAIHGQAFGG